MLRVGYAGYGPCRPLGTDRACPPHSAVQTRYQAWTVEGAVGVRSLRPLVMTIRQKSAKQDNAKADVVVTIRGRVIVAVRRTAVPRIVVERTTTDHAGRAGTVRSVPFLQAPRRRPSSSARSAANRTWFAPSSCKAAANRRRARTQTNRPSARARYRLRPSPRSALPIKIAS
jgi:hypothetical protein